MALAGLSSKIFHRDAAFAKALGEWLEKDLVFCGDESIQPHSRKLDPHLFIGPRKRAVFLVGLRNTDLMEWQTTKSGSQINDAIKVMAEGAHLLFWKRGAPKVTDAGTPVLVDVAVPETIKDCKEHGPKSFECGSSNGPRGCCDEGGMKIYGFQLTWKDPEGVGRWKLKFHPGGTVLTAEGAGLKEPVRYCAMPDPVGFRP